MKKDPYLEGIMAKIETNRAAGGALTPVEEALDALFRDNGIPMSDANARLYDRIVALERDALRPTGLRVDLDGNITRRIDDQTRGRT